MDVLLSMLTRDTAISKHFRLILEIRAVGPLLRWPVGSHALDLRPSVCISDCPPCGNSADFKFLCANVGITGWEVEE